MREGPHKEVMRKLRVSDFMQHLDEDDEPLDAIDPEEDKDWLFATDSVEAALRVFDRSGNHMIPVVDPKDKTKIIGWAGHIPALDAFNRALIDAHIEGHK